MFIKYYKIILFSLNFLFKFCIYKIYKFIFINFLNIKVIHIFIYYYINLTLFVKNLGKFIYNKLFWYIYLKFKIYKIYYINMYLHYYIFS